jgi:beta-glucanase (GH16 family)
MKHFRKSIAGILAGIMCSMSVPAFPTAVLNSAYAAAGQTYSVGNGQTQHKDDNVDGYSYEIWLDNTGGSGSMTLGSGGSFNTEWSAQVSAGNFLARRGRNYDASKKATQYGSIVMDYAAEYSASAQGNSRLCVYGWMKDPLVEYYIIEDWVNWCPSANGGAQTITVDGAEYEIFQLDHTGPTILGDTRTFKQYFSVRKQKRTSGTITVSDHFKAWEKAGWNIGNLTEVALNVEGWESSGKANVSKLTISEGSGGSNNSAPQQQNNDWNQQWNQPQQQNNDWNQQWNQPQQQNNDWNQQWNQPQQQNNDQNQWQQPQQNNNQQASSGSGFNASATMADDFRNGSSRYFIASDGWTNGNPFDCGWYASQTNFSGGALNLTIDRDSTGKYNYAGAEYRTNDFYHYGYYETSMQAIKNKGVVSSFFTYTGESDGNPWDEIDIEILGKDTTKVQFNYYTNGKADHEYMYDLGFDSSQGFHTYGFDWQPDHITWYVDGKPVYTATDNIPKTAGKLMMNVWPGTGVDEWLDHFDGRTPLTARYQWATYDKNGKGSSNNNNNQNQNNNQQPQQNDWNQWQQPQQTTTQWQPATTTVTTTVVTTTQQQDWNNWNNQNNNQNQQNDWNNWNNNQNQQNGWNNQNQWNNQNNNQNNNQQQYPQQNNDWNNWNNNQNQQNNWNNQNNNQWNQQQDWNNWNNQNQWSQQWQQQQWNQWNPQQQQNWNQWTQQNEWSQQVSMWGDANNSGSVDLSDSVFIMQTLANPNKYSFEDQGRYNADVYQSGTGITGQDATAVQRYLLNSVQNLPESFWNSNGTTWYN